jgi:hypothetical protein
MTPSMSTRPRPGRSSGQGLAVAVALAATAVACSTGPSTSGSRTEPLPLSGSLRAAAPMTRAAPTRLQVPAVGVDSALMSLGLQRDGTLEVPPAGFPAGWYTGSPAPGEVGPAIIAGHIDWGGGPGVFFHLRDLRRGDRIIVTRSDGSLATFQVTAVKRFRKTAFPTALVYGNIDHAGLRLISCGGAFDRRAHTYLDNIVVFADLIRSSHAAATASSTGRLSATLGRSNQRVRSSLSD